MRRPVWGKIRGRNFPPTAVAERPARTFSSLRSALSLPGPERGAKTPWEYPHEDFNRVKIRVHPPSASGHARRQLAIRARYTLNGQPDEDRGSYLEFDELDKLKSKEADAQFQHALSRALQRLQDIDDLKATLPGVAEEAAKKATRMSVAAAWARHDVESRANRVATLAKERSQFGAYLAHLNDKFLDDLPYRFWSSYLDGLGHGKLLNADGITWTQLPTKRAEATVIGVMNLAAKLYEIAHSNDGLPGKARDWNPAAEAKRKLAKKPNKRTHYLRLNRLAAAWAAADVMCSGWARDQLRLYVLTGLRHGLMSELQFAEVDAKAKVLRISPHKPGTKRRGSDTPDDAPDIRIPISATALAIIEARRPWAPDTNGPVWYSVAQPGGKAAKDGPRDVPIHSDPRSNWARLAEAVLDGEAFAPHDLRRTFAQVATEAGANLLGASLLMLHSPRTVAKTLGLPEITLDYINTAEAQGRMRRAAESIEHYVLGLLDGSIRPPEAEQELDPELAAAVGKDED